MIPFKYSNPPESFFEEETRNDYIISPEMKKVWATQIEILKKFESVCEKYGLRYWAEGGTLLGTIRGGGYIPWDDDMDLCLLREDYDKFIEVAPSEFEAPFFVQNYHTQPLFGKLFTRIRVDGTAQITSYQYPHEEYHQGIFVDVFPIDKTIPGELLQGNKEFNHAIMRARMYGNSHIWRLRTKREADLEEWSAQREMIKGLWSQCEALATRFRNEDTDWITNLIINRDLEEKTLKKFEHVESRWPHPFEYTTIMVPDGYEYMLETQYGKDWRTPQQLPSYHRSMFINADVDFRTIRNSRVNYRQLPSARQLKMRMNRALDKVEFTARIKNDGTLEICQGNNLEDTKK